MEKLILVGNHHEDFKGPERLQRILTHYQPVIVCLEETPKTATEGWRFHQRCMELSKNPALSRIYNQEQLERVQAQLLVNAYEVWVPKTYKNGSPKVKIYCIDKDMGEQILKDLSQAQRQWIMQQLSAGKKLESLMAPDDEPIEEFVRNGSLSERQAYTDRVYDRNDITEHVIRRIGIENALKIIRDRDDHFAQEIRKIYEEIRLVDNACMVVTLGNGHLTGTGRNVYEQLKDLNPKRMTLKEADQL